MSPITSRRARTLLGASAATAVALTGVILTGGASSAAGSATTEPAVPAASTAIRGADSATAIPNSYVVVLKEQATKSAVTASTSSLAASYDAKVRRTFSAALHGFSATMSEAKAQDLAKDPKVAFVQQNQKFTIDQDDPPWGLDRADQRDLPLDQKYEPSTAADNVNVYVIDTGIYAEHNDFGGRASVGTDTVGDGQDGKDCQGHGSHVAGTIAGETYGLAKGATIFGVRVLDCSGSGSTESVVAGIDWVTANAKKPAVANMSLGGGADAALDAAVEASVEAGITFAVAAGNESSDACNVSPARTPGAITTGATDSTDTAATFSNFGKCVDVFAPGVKVESVSIDAPDASAELSGTSMASPHVAGGAALFLADNPDATPAEVAEALVGKATPDKVQNPGEGSPNLLLYVGAGDTTVAGR